MTPDTQKWREKAREIVSIIADKESEIRKMGFASMFLEAIENSIASVAAEAGYAASQNMLQIAENGYTHSEFITTLKALRISASNYPAPGEGV